MSPASDRGAAPSGRGLVGSADHDVASPVAVHVTCACNARPEDAAAQGTGDREAAGAERREADRARGDSSEHDGAGAGSRQPVGRRERGADDRLGATVAVHVRDHGNRFPASSPLVAPLIETKFVAAAARSTIAVPDLPKTRYAAPVPPFASARADQHVSATVTVEIAGVDGRAEGIARGGAQHLEALVGGAEGVGGLGGSVALAERDERRSGARARARGQARRPGGDLAPSVVVHVSHDSHRVAEVVEVAVGGRTRDLVTMGACTRRQVERAARERAHAGPTPAKMTQTDDTTEPRYAGAPMTRSGRPSPLMSPDASDWPKNEAAAGPRIVHPLSAASAAQVDRRRRRLAVHDPDDALAARATGRVRDRDISGSPSPFQSPTETMRPVDRAGDGRMIRRCPADSAAVAVDALAVPGCSASPDATARRTIIETLPMAYMTVLDFCVEILSFCQAPIRG